MTKEIELHFLGSGDAFGSGGRLQTCLYVSGLNNGFLIDCGASSLIAIKRNGMDASRIGWVLLTHLHGDHFGGLPFLVLDGQFSRRTLPLVIAGPPGVASRVEAAMEVFFPGSWNVTRRFPLEFIELAEREPTQVGPSVVTALAVRHPSGSPSYGIRVQFGEKVISYSGDTEWTASLLDLARDVDVLVCEAYCFEKRIPYHLDYSTLLKHRSELGCRRLIMTHMSDDLLHRLDEVKIEAAQDGGIIPL
jgi:ribonuclease BN (tRNA processing enzyme)